MGTQWLESLRTFDVQTLSFKQAGAWTTGRQAATVVLVMAAVLALGYMLLVQPGLAHLQQQRSVEPQLKAQWEARVREVATLERYRQHLQSLQTTFDNVHSQLPSQAQVPGLLEEVSRISLSRGLVIEHMQWLPQTLQPFYTELPLQLLLVGGYHDLGLFLSDIATLPRIVTLHDFTLTAAADGANGPLRMTLLAKTYRANDQGLIP